jgi:hypothetical protein
VPFQLKTGGAACWAGRKGDANQRINP